MCYTVNIKHISEPFKSANRKFHPKDSIIEVGEQKLKVGHGNFALIAGPCSVESEEQIISVAKSVKAAGSSRPPPQKLESAMNCNYSTKYRQSPTT